MGLSENQHVYRMAHITMRDKKNKAIPAIRCFTPLPVDQYKLSVDHAENTTPENSLSRVGATLKTNGTYKNLYEFEIYVLNAGKVKNIAGIIDVFKDPIDNIPEIVGKPNNPSHALIHISETAEEDEPEIYSKLRDNASLVKTDYEAAISLSDQIKNRWIT